MEDLGLPYFRTISTFGALSDTTVVHLIRCGEVQALEPGEILFEAGDPSEGFYIILKGQLAFHKYHQGHYGFIRNYHFGENIGFVGMIALHRRIGRARAVGEVIVVKISTRLFNDLYETNTQEFALLLMNLSRDMARGIRAVDNLLVEQHYSAMNAQGRKAVAADVDEVNLETADLAKADTGGAAKVRYLAGLR